MPRQASPLGVAGGGPAAAPASRDAAGGVGRTFGGAAAAAGWHVSPRQGSMLSIASNGLVASGGDAGVAGAAAAASGSYAVPQQGPLLGAAGGALSRGVGAGGAGAAACPAPRQGTPLGVSAGGLGVGPGAGAGGAAACDAEHGRLPGSSAEQRTAFQASLERHWAQERVPDYLAGRCAGPRVVTRLSTGLSCTPVHGMTHPPPSVLPPPPRVQCVASWALLVRRWAQKCAPDHLAGCCGCFSDDHLLVQHS